MQFLHASIMTQTPLVLKVRVGPIHRTIPITIILLQHPICWGYSSLRNNLKLLQKGLLIGSAAHQAPLRDLQALQGQILDRTIPKLGPESVRRDPRLEVPSLLLRPISNQLERFLLSLVVVQQTHPEGGQGADAAEGPAVGAAHLQKLFHAHLREHRGEMVLPVLQGGVLPGQQRQLPRHEVPERHADGVEVLAVAVHKVHGHVQHPVHVPGKAHAFLKHPGQVARARVVCVSPHVAAVTDHAVGLAIFEWGGCEQGSDHRLQGQADAEFLHHVLFALKVQVHLHRARPEHHVQTHGAHCRHVLFHDRVAPLGHDWGVFHAPLGLEAASQKKPPQSPRL
mmetsp:Transcript_15045/g.28973  ORF Transcript_15045/g.28973 Transcript_15045/m.28973 type:complete len:339 (+) Transcript_15045:213-1229(+)